MNIITGYKGEAHITAQEDRDINLGVVGKSTSDLYVLDVGQKLEAEIVSSNVIRIHDGVLVMQGCAASIDYGSYDSMSISNGSQGMQRIDIIAAQYSRNGVTNVETVSLVVVQGTPAISNPSAPSLTSGSIQSGDQLVQMPLYYVNLNGVSISSVDAQFTLAPSLDGAAEDIADIRSGWKYQGSATGTQTVTVPNSAAEVLIVIGTSTNTYRGTSPIISTSNRWMIAGYWATSSDWGYANVNITNNGRTYQIRNYYYGGASGSATMYVYYK